MARNSILSSHRQVLRQIFGSNSRSFQTLIPSPPTPTPTPTSSLFSPVPPKPFPSGSSILSGSSRVHFSDLPFSQSRPLSSSSGPSNIVLVNSENDFNSSLSKAQDDSVPAIFYFTAVWCGPCRFIGPIIGELSEKYPHVTTYKIDIDQMKPAASIAFSKLDNPPKPENSLPVLAYLIQVQVKTTLFLQHVPSTEAFEDSELMAFGIICCIELSISPHHCPAPPLLPPHECQCWPNVLFSSSLSKCQPDSTPFSPHPRLWSPPFLQSCPPGQSPSLNPPETQIHFLYWLPGLVSSTLLLHCVLASLNGHTDDRTQEGLQSILSKLNITSVPTLHFYQNGKKAAEVIGADVARLTNTIEKLYKCRIVGIKILNGQRKRGGKGSPNSFAHLNPPTLIGSKLIQLLGFSPTLFTSVETPTPRWKFTTTHPLTGNVILAATSISEYNLAIVPAVESTINAVQENALFINGLSTTSIYKSSFKMAATLLVADSCFRNSRKVLSLKWHFFVFVALFGCQERLIEDSSQGLMADDYVI
uniref:Thioredoxin domain-containing protein n=1 Tax=Quercus lobata TaxID=97700 RepID=A0A7N2MWP0_QUELO